MSSLDDTGFWDATSLAWAGPRRSPPPDRSISEGPGPLTSLWRPPSLRCFQSPPDGALVRSILLGVHGHRHGRRAVPSAGAIYGFTVSLIDLASASCWRVAAHGTVTRLARSEVDEHRLRAAFFHQIEGPAMIAVLSVDCEPYLERYGERGLRYILIEAGHYGQEIIRGCHEAGLRVCPLGGFDDGALREVVAGRTRPVYALAIGTPGEGAG